MGQACCVTLNPFSECILAISNRYDSEATVPDVAKIPICPFVVKSATASTLGRITPSTLRRGAICGKSTCCIVRKAFAEEIPGTTKLIIAQRISSVQSADRIIVLDEGKINGFGTHEELLANNAIYRDVYESQTGGGGDFDENGGAQ